jgi:hypothetical protein
MPIYRAHRRFIGPHRHQPEEVETEQAVAVSIGAGVKVGGVGTLVVARGWGDRLPARGEPEDQDAGDHKGPFPSPHHSRPYGFSRPFSLRLMRITAGKSAIDKCPVIQVNKLKIIIRPNKGELE